MSNTIVTTGQKYTDIDALSCAVSYTELLSLNGIKTHCVLPGPLNKSVSRSMRKWKLNFLTVPPPGNFYYVLVDISDPSFFAEFVSAEKITEVFDHRPGFEKFWEKKIGKGSHIEAVGSCTTLIWEMYKKFGAEKRISQVAANLMYTTTFSHTLNFKSSVTTPRDINTFNDLGKYVSLPENWIEKYFEEEEKEVLKNPTRSIVNDTKIVNGVAVAQVELWNSRKFLEKNRRVIERTLKGTSVKGWFLTSPSISEGKNYIFSTVDEIKNLLTKKMGIRFNRDVAVTDGLLLRKEILTIIN